MQRSSWMGASKGAATSTCGVLLALLCAWRPLPSRACAALSITSDSVSVLDETAAIVWDEGRHTEHFIRRATFDARGQSVGFLVPTPGVPLLSAVDEGAFERLASWTLPERSHQNHWRLKPFLLLGSLMGRRLSNTFNAAASHLSTSTDGIEVLSTQHLAGYEAAVLAARDAHGLSLWLRAHGYPSSRALGGWLQPYIAQGWKITAFKIARPKSAGRAEDAGGRTFSSSAVRMSFSSAWPFFPYREPTSQRRGKGILHPRSLRVFFLSTERVQGVIGRGASTSAPGAREWPGQASWSSMVQDNKVRLLAGELKMARTQLPPRVWMTAFEDLSSPRPGFDDVFFSPAPEQSQIVPWPIVSHSYSDIPVPVDGALGALVLLAYALSMCIERAERLRQSESRTPKK